MTRGYQRLFAKGPSNSGKRVGPRVDYAGALGRLDALTVHHRARGLASRSRSRSRITQALIDGPPRSGVAQPRIG